MPYTEMVYLVWQNDFLHGVYRAASRAIVELNRVKGREGGRWTLISRDKDEPFIERWAQESRDHGVSIARLEVEPRRVE
jgi:hypothetical protein